MNDQETTLNFAEAFLVHRGLTPGALMTFIFLQCQQQVKVFILLIISTSTGWIFMNIHMMYPNDFGDALIDLPSEIAGGAQTSTGILK